MVSYVSKISAKAAPHFGRVNFSNLISYTPDLALWGVAWMSGVFVFTEGWPKFQDAIYKKIPYLGSHWTKEIPAEDRPN